MGDVKPTIGRSEVEEIVDQAFTVESETETKSKSEAPQAEPVKEIESTSTQGDRLAEIEMSPEEGPTGTPEPEPEDQPNDEPETPEPGPEPEAPEIREPEVREPEKLEAIETASHLNDAPSAEQLVAQTEAPKPRLEDDLFKPAFEISFERKEPVKTEPKEEKEGQIAFDDLLGSDYKDPVFVKPEDLAREAASHVPPTPKPEVIPIARPADRTPVYKMSNNEIADRTVSLNDRLSKGITVGLNDRIAFVKHLFGNSNEDYNRVLSQLITFNSFEEARDFIENMVRPDYNNWEGKDEYAARFMEVVEKKFN